MTWRLDKAAAGSGSLGDIGAHAVDLVEHLTGSRLATVSGTLATFVEERPLLGETVGLSGTASEQRGRVTVDDAAWFTARLEGGRRGAIGAFEATRYATGRKNSLRIELSGSRGAIAFDLEAMNELQFYDATAPAGEQGFTRIIVTEPEHPYMANWWPTGHAIGYEHALQPRGGRLRHRRGERHRPRAVVRRRPPHPARPRRRRAQRRRRQRLDPRPGRDHGARRRTHERKQALVVRGGWDGHMPVETTDAFIPFLRENDFDVRVEEGTAVYADDAVMDTVDLVVQVNTMSTIEDASSAACSGPCSNGTGMAGWHGGIADSYRNNADYLHMIGGQFAHHAGKDPAERVGDQSDNYIPYTVHITEYGRTHPITAGIDDFDLVTEQYWVLSDEYNDVLATTTQRSVRGMPGIVR